MAANVPLPFAPHLKQAARAHAVYVRQHWFAPWEQVSWLFAASCTWPLAPAVGQASLYWDYGRGMRQGENVLATVARLAERNRWFVKVEIDLTDVAEDQYLRWYGTIEMQGQEHCGLLKEGDAAIPTGRMPLVAFGLEQLLYRTPIRKSVWMETDAGAEHTVDRVFAFNPPGPDNKAVGNRSAVPGTKSYCFSDVIGAAASNWSTRDAVQYLMAWHGPKGVFDVTMPFWALEVASEHLLPDWDKPSVECQGKNLGEQLDTLIPRGRSLAWRLVVDDSDPDDIAPRVLLRPVSLLGQNVTTPEGTLRENPRRLAIDADANPDWQTAIKDTSNQRVDQVRIRGAEATATCTLSKPDSSLDLGWTSGHETTYEAAASGIVGYAALGTDEKQRRNAQARSQDVLFPVYRRFAIPDAWPQTVKNGLGAGDAVPVFPVIPPTVPVYPVCPRTLRILPTLPFLEGYDYEDLGDVYGVVTPPTRVSVGPHERVPPLVLFQIPGSSPTRWIQVERAGDGIGIETVDPAKESLLACRIEVPESDRAILLHVQGKPQHAIATADFTRLAVDPYAGAWNWRTALFTVAVSDDRYCEGIWPPDIDARANVVGCRRELLLEAGDKYRLDYVVPNTVIGVDGEGALVRCTGGGYANDDRELLESRAKQAYEYYKQTRRSITLQTGNLVSALDLRLGDYVHSIGTADPQEIGSVISEITLAVPEDATRTVTLTYTTAFAELDPLTFLTGEPVRGHT